MVREGWKLSKITDPDALAWEDHQYWQSLSVGERLRISIEMSQMMYQGRVTEAVSGRERLPRSSHLTQQA